MGSLYFRSHGSCELLASWHGKRLISMPLTWLLSPPLTQASRLLFAWARPPTVSSTELTDDANADYFFFPPSFFAVITVILHGWRCTSTGSILTADSFFYLNEKKKKLICLFYPNWDDFCCCQKFISHRSDWNSELEIGHPEPKPEAETLFLGIITSYYFWLTYIFNF